MFKPSRIAAVLVIALATLATLSALRAAEDSTLDCVFRIWSTPSPPAPISQYTAGSPRARSVSPQELLDGPVDAETTSMPKIIHQSWKTTTLPARFAAWSASWRVTHPDWLAVLWTDADNRQLVERFYPDYLDAYDALPREIYRADMARNFCAFVALLSLTDADMHRFGGVYADADVEAIKPIDELLACDQPTAFLARLRYNMSYIHSLPNAFLASTPGHPFWLRPVDHVRDHYTDYQLDSHEALRGGLLLGPERLTGPVALRHVAMNYRQGSTPYRLVMLPPSSIFPYDHHNNTAYERCVCSAQRSTLDTTRCKALHSDAYTISYWSQSWGQANWAQLTGQATQLAGPIFIGAGLALVAALGLIVWQRSVARAGGRSATSVELEAFLASDQESSRGRSSSSRRARSD